MRIARIIAAGWFGWIVARALGASTGADSPPAELGELLAPIFSEAKIPGGAALVLRGDLVIAHGVAGVRKRGGSERITPDDKFHLGSCTKAMTATLAAVLVEEGRLRWTATLPELFGDAVPRLHDGWRTVTLAQMLAHRAGLPANLGRLISARLAFTNDSIVEQRRLIAREILGGELEYAPGTQFLYSNVGFTLVGAAAEQAAGRAWEELMEEKLFKPLGITTAGFGAPGTPGQVDQPWGHRTRDGEPVEPGPRSDNLPAIGPAGTAHMNLRDWAKFITLHLRGHPSNPRRQVTLLKERTFDLLLRPAPGETYVNGWGTSTRPWAKGARDGDTGAVFTHAGSNTMWFCVVWVAPEIDFAALVACNAADGDVPKACDRVAGQLVQRFARAAAAWPASR